MRTIGFSLLAGGLRAGGLLGGGLLGGAFARTAAAQSGGWTSSGADLSGYRWQNRILIVFAPILQDPRLAAQRLRRIEDRSGYRDRDLTVIEVVARSVMVDGTRTRALDSFELRSRFEIDDDLFVTLLIGKDGGEKLRREGLMPTDVLFETIDRMPLREQEMREQETRQ